MPVCGCTDLMVVEPEKRARMDRVIDLLRIREIHGVAVLDGCVQIGATTTFAEIRRSLDVQKHLPALVEAASVVGGWQIQNRATIGGNVANASPAGDSLPVLLALGAVVVAVGPAGTREIPYDDFHVAYRKTALQSGEIIAWLRLPIPGRGAFQAFRKVGTREAQAISKVVVALAGRTDQGRVVDIRLAAGSVAPTPVRLHRAEDLLRGKPLTAEAAEAAGRAAASEVNPIDDVRSTAVYRKYALERVVRRMILELATSK